MILDFMEPGTWNSFSDQRSISLSYCIIDHLNPLSRIVYHPGDCSVWIFRVPSRENHAWNRSGKVSVRGLELNFLDPVVGKREGFSGEPRHKVDPFVRHGKDATGAGRQVRSRKIGAQEAGIGCNSQDFFACKCLIRSRSSPSLPHPGKAP